MASHFFKGRMIAPSLFYFLKKKITTFLRRNSKKEILSMTREVELETKEILEKIKEIKGIFYDDKSGVLTVTEEMPEKKFRGILNWSRIHGYGNFAGTLRSLFKDTHYEYFFEKTHWNPRPDSISPFFIIEGGNIFSGAYPCPKFWLEWRATFEVANEKEALKERFWNDLFYYETLIESSISEAMSNYIFEVYEENRCSFIYEASAMYEKERECLPNPFYLSLWQILGEAKESLNNNPKQRAAINFFIQRGFKIEYLSEKIFYPIQKPYLGLCEISKNVQEKASAGIYKPIIAKIEKTLEETKKEEIGEEIEVKNEESLTTGSKVNKEINIFPEKPLGEQIEIYPLCSREKFKDIKTILHPLLKFLLERNVQSEYIHWVYGFVIFHSWRKGTERLVTNPAKTFDDYISLLNGFGGKEGLWEIERKGEGKDAKHEKENLEFKSLGFSSNLFEAHNLYKRAMEIVDPLKKKEGLTIAWQKYPDFIEVNSSLVDCWIREGFKGVDDKNINKMLKFFENKDYNYSQAYDVITQKRKEKRKEEEKMSYWDLPSVREVIRELLEEREKFKKYLRILECQRGDKKKILSPDEIEYEELKDLILLIIKENKEDKDAEPDILQPQNITFGQLIKKPAISSVINIVKYKIKNERFLEHEHEVVQKIIGPATEASLWLIIAENRINFNKLTALNELKNWLIKTLVQEINNQINEGSLPIEFDKPRPKKQFDELS